MKDPAWTPPTIQRLYMGPSHNNDAPTWQNHSEKPDTCELVSTSMPFITVYGITENFVEILSFRYAAQEPRHK